MRAPWSELAVRGLRSGLVVYGDALGLCQADPAYGDVRRILTWRTRPDEVTLIRQRACLRGYLRWGSILSVVCLGDAALVRHVACPSDAPWTYLLHCRVGSRLSLGQSSLLTAFMTRAGIVQLRDTTFPGAVGGGLSLTTLAAFPSEGLVLRAGLGKLHLGRSTEESGLAVEVETSEGQAVLRVSADGVTLGECDRVGPGLPHCAWLAPERLGRRLGLPATGIRVVRGGRCWWSGDESWVSTPRPLDYLGGLAQSLGSVAAAFVAHNQRKAFVGVLRKGQVDVAVVEDVFIHITHNRLWAFASTPVASTPCARFTLVSDLDAVDRFECVSGAAAMLTTMATAAFVRDVRVSLVVQHVSADMEVIDAASQEILLNEGPVNVSLSPIIGPHMARSQVLVIQLTRVIQFYRCDLQRGLEFVRCADVTLPYIAESLCWRQDGGNTFAHLIGLGPRSKQSKRLTLLTQHGFQVDYCDAPPIPNAGYSSDSDDDEGQEVALDCTFADDEVTAFLASVKAERLVTPAGRALEGKACRQPSSEAPTTPRSVWAFRDEQATLADEARGPLQLPRQLDALARTIRGHTLTSQEAYDVFGMLATFVDEDAVEDLTIFVSGGSLWMPLLRLDPLQAREPDVAACLSGLSRLIRVNDDTECAKAREVIRFVFQQ